MNTSTDDPLMQQMVQDIQTHLPEEKRKELWLEIDEMIRAEELHIDEHEREHHILKAMATYATSHVHYGPVLADWAHSLLDTALVEKRKLIFLARDGIAPYKAAQMLQAAYAPKYDSVQISLIFISRTLAYSSTLMDEKISSTDEHVRKYLSTLRRRDPYILRKYIQQECDLKKNDRCIFVDVGFTGSIITPIVSQLRGLGISVRFNYLISHTTKKKVKSSRHHAKGFLAHNETRPLEVVSKAGGNPAVHWLEDTHQSVIPSAKILIKKENGKIAAATVTKVGHEFHIKEVLSYNYQHNRHQPDEYLVKTFGLKGVLDSVATAPKNHPGPSTAWREASEHRRQAFGEFLQTLHTKQRALLIKH